MKRTACLGSIAALCCLSGTALAQDDASPEGYAYVTYFECDAGREYRADEIIELNFKPHYDAAVEAADKVGQPDPLCDVAGLHRRGIVRLEV